MKKILAIIIGSLILSACTTSSDSTENVTDQIVRDFARGLETGNIELLMSAYHDDAELIFVDSEGNNNITSGSGEIRTAQQANFEQDMYPEKVLIDTWKKEVSDDVITYKVIVSFDIFQFMNTLELTIIDNNWGIIRQKVEFYSAK